MIDKSEMEMNGIHSVFKEARILLCHFHVKQAWQRWLGERSKSRLPHGDNNKTYKAVLDDLNRWMAAPDQPRFMARWEGIKRSWGGHYPLVIKYLEENWLGCREK